MHIIKKIIIVHQWGSSPKGDWYPWLKEKLEDKGFKVLVPKMPNADEPKIEEWVPKLKQVAKIVDKNMYFIGHSVGCQTILRYLEKLPNNTKIGGCLFVAGWFNLIKEAIESEGVADIARPWIEAPIDFNKVKNVTKNFAAIFSDNDPYVPISDSKIFKKKLGARIIIEHSKGHFTEDDGIEEVPVVLRELSKIIK